MPENRTQDYRFYVAWFVENHQQYRSNPNQPAQGHSKLACTREQGILINHVEYLGSLGAKADELCYKTWLYRADDQHNPQYVFTGILSVNASGTGGNVWEFNPHNVGGSGYPIDEFLWSAISLETIHNFRQPENTIILSGTMQPLSPEAAPTGLIKIEPFQAPLPGHNWWKIPDLFNPPDDYYSSQIMGTVITGSGEVEYMIHGILGHFTKREQPYQGRTGYVHWRPLGGRKKFSAGNLGYWLLYFNPQTGEPAFPLEAAEPK